MPRPAAPQTRCPTNPPPSFATPPAYRKAVFVDNRQDNLEILDTAGQDEFTQYRHQWMRHKDAYIFVFSLTNRQSLHELDAYAQLHYMENCTKAVTPPVLLVGSKKDLVENGENRQVSVAEAEQSLGRWRDMFRNSDVRLGPFLYMETSSKVRVRTPSLCNGPLLTRWALVHFGQSSYLTPARPPAHPRGQCPTLAQTGENVEKAFENIVREIRRCRTGHVSMYGGRPKKSGGSTCSLFGACIG